MKEKYDNNISFSHEAIVGVAITAISYLVAYIFEKSYLSYFEIPEGLVQVEIKSIILAGLSVLGITALVYQFSDILATFMQHNFSDKPMAKVFDSYGIIFTAFLILCLFADLAWYKKAFLLTIPFYNMWLQIVMPFFEMKRYGSYSEAQNKIIEWTNCHGGLEQRYTFFGNTFFLRFVLLAIYLMIAGQTAGYMLASSHKEYFSDESGRVLIRAYSESAIMAYSDGNKLTGVFVVQPINGLKLKKIDSEINVFDKKGVDSQVYGGVDKLYNSVKNFLSGFI